MRLFNCPKCNNHMEEGFVVDNADGGARLQSRWIEGEPEQAWLSGVKTRGRRKISISTFRSTNCGYLESFARPGAPQVS